MTANGYEVIGMDHFAKKDDELASAKVNKQLHRNFQGYNTLKTTGQVYAFGASGISQLNGAFAQNIKAYDKYIQAIESDGFAVDRGYILNNKENETPKEIKLFDNFSSSLIKKWDGKVCYQEMFNLNYRNKFQPEWPGFYLEFKFEKYLEDNMNLKDICTFVSNKKNGQLDFDLNFSDKYLGDLKAHSVDSYYIPGNDKNNFLEAIRIYNKFWYVVFYHKTYMDKNYNNTVAKFWNEIQGKKDLLSYSNRMKNSIELTGIKILEINKYNVKYISDMTQGKNSNGKTRAIKIQIHKNFVDNFLIFNKNL